MAGDYERFYERGIGHPDELITIASICEQYGWTWNEYWDQPKPFTDAIRVKRDVESRVQERQNKEMERRTKLNGGR